MCLPKPKAEVVKMFVELENIDNWTNENFYNYSRLHILKSYNKKEYVDMFRKAQNNKCTLTGKELITPHMDHNEAYKTESKSMNPRALGNFSLIEGDLNMSISNISPNCMEEKFPGCTKRFENTQEKVRKLFVFDIYENWVSHRVKDLPDAFKFAEGYETKKITSLEDPYWEKIFNRSGPTLKKYVESLIERRLIKPTTSIIKFLENRDKIIKWIKDDGWDISKIMGKTYGLNISSNKGKKYFIIKCNSDHTIKNLLDSQSESSSIIYLMEQNSNKILQKISDGFNLQEIAEELTFERDMSAFKVFVNYLKLKEKNKKMKEQLLRFSSKGIQRLVKKAEADCENIESLDSLDFISTNWNKKEKTITWEMSY